MIKETGIINTENDLYRLNIIDFGRLNKYWNHQGEAMHTILSWVKGTAKFTIAEIDLSFYPIRN